MKPIYQKPKAILISLLGILFSMIFAVVVHALLPAGVDINKFDSFLVLTLGFPVTVCLYFAILYLHCSFVTGYFGAKSKLSRSQVALRYGLSFAIIYILGMQEIAVDASPYGEWGWEFVRYQLIMGLGDALPVLLLCFLISFVFIKNTQKNNLCPSNKKTKWIFSILFTLIFFVVRTIEYKTQIIGSDIARYPIQTHIWTIIFGFFIGMIFQFLYPIHSNNTKPLKIDFKIAILTIGLNWIIFNGFIGMIMKGSMIEMLLRAGIDTMVWFVSAVIIRRLICRLKYFP